MKEEPEKVLPLGADFKKVSIEQIQAREERLRQIKDQGLIQINFDDNVQSVEEPNLAEAFAAKRRARMQQKEPLDQDLAVARDASAQPSESKRHMTFG